MVINSAKLEKFIFEHLEYKSKDSNINKTNYIFDVLMNSFHNSESNILDKKEIKLYFTDEQLDSLKVKQKELGYEDNFSRFVRYTMFDDFLKQHNIEVIDKKFLGELINNDKFNLLLDKCKHELLHGEYTSYDLDLLRNNKKYEGKISFRVFNDFTEEEPFNIDFLECDMLIFLQSSFEKGKLYSELEGLSTEQTASNFFTEMEDGETLEPFTDYDNIVPNTDSFYYLLVYYVFTELTEDFEDSDIAEIFDETEEHINFLLEKYTFEKIIKYYKQKYNIMNIDKIFDEQCIENLKSNNLIEFNEIVEPSDINDDGPLVLKPGATIKVIKTDLFSSDKIEE